MWLLIILAIYAFYYAHGLDNSLSRFQRFELYIENAEITLSSFHEHFDEIYA